MRSRRGCDNLIGLESYFVNRRSPMYQNSLKQLVLDLERAWKIMKRQITYYSIWVQIFGGNQKFRKVARLWFYFLDYASLFMDAYTATIFPLSFIDNWDVIHHPNIAVIWACPIPYASKPHPWHGNRRVTVLINNATQVTLKIIFSIREKNPKLIEAFAFQNPPSFAEPKKCFVWVVNDLIEILVAVELYV